MSRKPSKTFRITLDEKKWKVRVVKRVPRKEDLDGLCDYNERTIYLREDTLSHNAIGITIHEMLHALFPCLSEDAVLEAEVSISTVLWWLNRLRGGQLSVEKHKE